MNPPAVPASGPERPFRILFHFRTRGTGAEGVHLSGMAKGFERAGGAEVVFSSPLGNDPRETRGGNPFKQRSESLLARFSRKCPRWLFELLELGYNLSAWRRNRRLLRGGGFSLIYERHAFFLFITAAMAARRSIPFAVEVNELAGDPRIRAQPTLQRMIAWADRFVFKRAGLIVVVSQHLARRAVERGAPAEKVMVLPNAVEPSALARPDQGAAVRGRFGLLPDEVVIGFVGWFVEWHQLDRLVSVCALLHREGLPVRLMMVGDGPLDGELRALAEREGFAQRVVWTGPVGHDEVPDFISAFDIAVVPQSNSYRSPIKLFEYLAMSRPVVAPRVEPIESVTGACEAVTMFHPDSAEEMAAALRSVAAADAETRARMGRAGHALVAANHTWDHNARRVLDALGFRA